MRTPADILARSQDTGPEQPVQAPTAANKWLTASVTDAAATVVGRIFDEADRRDPTHLRTWIALVDGNNHQIDRIRAEAAARRCRGDHPVRLRPRARVPMESRLVLPPRGRPRRRSLGPRQSHRRPAGQSHPSRRRDPPRRHPPRPDPAQRAGADTCATYLINKAPYLDYPTALHNGWPIATGVIEGACRHLVKDRMDITGARWGLHGAEAILKLRALRSNGDFDAYWPYHLTQERHRVHETRYLNGTIPHAA